MKARFSTKKHITGQGMSEYLIILGLVAVAGIGVMSFFGQTVQNQVAGMSQEIAGVDAAPQIAQAAATATAADTSAQINTTLANYNTKQ